MQISVLVLDSGICLHGAGAAHERIWFIYDKYDSDILARYTSLFVVAKWIAHTAADAKSLFKNCCLQLSPTKREKFLGCMKFSALYLEFYLQGSQQRKFPVPNLVKLLC